MTLKILLVEDKSVDVALLEEMLLNSESWQWKIEVVKLLKEAIEELRTCSFDLVLLDLFLPDSQGLKTLSRLLEVTREIPIIALIDLNHQYLAKEALKLGAKDYLVRGKITPELLERSLRYAVELSHNLPRRQEIEQEFSQIKSKFVTMVSHEFRTPMSTILLSSGILENYGHKWSEERKKIHFDRIKSAIQRLNELLDEVLIIGKAEAGKLDFKPQALNLEKLCLSLVEEWQNYAGSDRLINFSYNGNCNAVEMDGEPIEQILSHLILNALKYSPTKEAIDLELNCIAPAGEEKKGVAILKICDRGIGIPTAEQKRLFETFFRASNVGTISGTGLGLAIVRALVDLQGGQIKIESKMNVGTVITINLPFFTID